MSILTDLGYAGSKHLHRSPEGIKTKNDTAFPVGSLLNYPTSVIFSGRAISKMDGEVKKNDNYLTIDIYANFASGKKVCIFSINTNFFSRVQKDQNTSEQFKQYQVLPLAYDSKNDSFENNWAGQRSYSLVKQSIAKEDILTSFGAEYLLGDVTHISKTYQFSQKFFNTIHEKLQLEIDVNPNDEWVLNICQTGKANNANELAEIRDLKYSPNDFICPITKKIMDDPVQDQEGNNYEKQAILEWIYRNPQSPKGTWIIPDALIPNEDLKQAVTKYKEANSRSSNFVSLPCSSLPRLGPDGMRQLEDPQKEPNPVEKKESIRIDLPPAQPQVIPKKIVEDKDEDDPLKCPITLDYMKDPVVAVDGHTYERAAIVDWISRKGTSPITSEPLTVETLKPNFAIKKLLIQAMNAKK